MEIVFIGKYVVESDSMHGNVTLNGRIVKAFKGETAWSDAERWAEDKHYAELYG